ncbi:endosomal cargo receptor [Polychytrium aggregatum]|uniref:endosomal cargo receptor n=1 Tax=Polychytrium aggregatum TaxID=110093 RepID=UPI0022FE4DD8|nr:endosomal cargo receptor [Polychytrium aggregatum]KAI9205906.1 endosomal cargo receptor [Polychytrium aggregatum]
MKHILLAVFVLLASIAAVQATTLTYRVQPHERACFYTLSSYQGEKIAFYFAVQSGGQFDIDFEVTDPRNEVIISANRERQVDYVFSAKHVGEYSFCFSNVMSTFAEKVIDFDITAEHENSQDAQRELQKITVTGHSDKTKDKPVETNQNPTAFDETLNAIGGKSSQIMRLQKYFRTRENRNFATVQSTENRIFWFAVGESAAIIAVAVIQVFLIQTFFSKPTRGRI